MASPRIFPTSFTQGLRNPFSTRLPPGSIGLNGNLDEGESGTTPNRQRTDMLKVTLTSLVALVSVCSFAQRAHPAKPAHPISAARAARVALAKYPGKVIGKVAMEDEEGKWQYSVNIQSGKVLREVMVGAGDGKIADVEVTNAKAEAKENAAEKKAAKHKKV